jgi:hypothetical protein
MAFCMRAAIVLKSWPKAGNARPRPIEGCCGYLILVVVFVPCSAFVQCHSKLVRRYGWSGIEVASQLHRSVSKLPQKIRAPDWMGANIAEPELHRRPA